MSRHMFYIHNGRHKTGTTRLQEFLTNNRTQLAPIGLNYPILHPGEIAHHSVALYLMDPATADRPADDPEQGAVDLRKLRDEGSVFDGVTIVSSEGLQNIEPVRVRALTGNAETRIFTYYREQASYALSAYSQHVIGTLYAGDFNDFLGNFFQAVNYPTFTQKWADEFGRENLVLRIYDREQLINNDIRLDFLDAINVQPGAGAFDLTSSRDTDNVCGDLLKMKILLNKRGFDESRHRARVVACLRALARQHPEMSAKPRISPRCARMIRAHYEQQNVDFFTRFSVGNGDTFRCADLSGDPDEPRLDQDFNPTDVREAGRIIEALSEMNTEIAELFNQTLKEYGVHTGIA